MRAILGRVWLVILIIFILFEKQGYADFDKLTKKNYEKFKNEKGVVIYGVNWGTHWGCAPFENAQLQNLTFTKINSSLIGSETKTISFDIPAKLLSRDISKSNVIMVNPGNYALTGFDIKVAWSPRKVGHIKKGIVDLIRNEEPIGGIFTVNPGEVIYIGDFGLDCTGEPIPWRYYIQREDFKSYVDGFKNKYKFIDREVIYRLFETEVFGKK